MKMTWLAPVLLFPGLKAFSQAQTDTLRTIDLREISVSAPRSNIERLQPLSGGFIWSGKKSEVISLAYTDAHIAEKTPRQIFAKVPGVFVYDMDGSGNQINISTRGLDPHRGWEFNIRKNGVIVNSDLYGYPASHYSMPMEAVERIELARGTGSLQYGSQFGGMLNYVAKQPDTTRKIGLESINSVGAFGLLSTYNAIGGKIGKLEYYAYNSSRTSNGYRDDGCSEYNGQSLMLRYAPSKRFALTAEAARSNYLYQIPGPLTDSMFRENPRQSSRSRNYFNPEIYVPSLRADWAPTENTTVQWTVSAVLGQRRSVVFDRPSTVTDAIDPLTLGYANRQVDIDAYNSYTSELRALHKYRLGKMNSSLAFGGQYFHNHLRRRQLGKGTTGSDYDLTLAVEGWGRDLHMKTRSAAFFAENLFQVNSRFSVSPGVRYETGASNLRGEITYLPEEEFANRIEHNFPLFGITTSYRLNVLQEFYGGWSQAYRPVLFKDIVPGSVFERVDKNFQDAFGYNLEAGYRGGSGNFKWDASVFRLRYDNRPGAQIIEDTIVFRTNIGNSVTHGVELFAEYNFGIGPTLRCYLFTSSSWMDARYEDALLRTGSGNTDISGNKVESVPEWISRNGATFRYKTFSINALYSYTGENFADPLNTVAPSATGGVGLVPAYGLLDFNATWRINGSATLRFSLNNALDRQYFTKRPSFYPGPGVWPSDGRSLAVSVGVRI
jgi:Fe(3+) dicitrate transport protein